MPDVYKQASDNFKAIHEMDNDAAAQDVSIKYQSIKVSKYPSTKSTLKMQQSSKLQAQPLEPSAWPAKATAWY